MASVQAEVSQKLAPGERALINRYFEASPVYPARFAQNWNRSYVMEPDGEPVGVVVLLHGLTDSPYSLRHVAQRYRDNGFVAVGIRLPAHGTVPAGLTACPMGRLDGRDAAGHTRSAPARARAGAAASGGLLERRCAGDEIRARRAGKPATPARRPRRAPHADDRHHAVCALCRAGQPAGAAAAVCQCRLAQRRSGVQPVQVQLVSRSTAHGSPSA